MESELKNTQLSLLMDEMADMANIGAWEVDLRVNKPIWSKEVYKIHEVEYGTEVGMDQAFSFYTTESQELLQAKFSNTITTGEPYDLELEIITAKGNRKWVRSICRPIIGENSVIHLLRGSFQDITRQVEEKDLKSKAQALIEDQNSRLVNFAHIISHNLRSHVGNLKMLTNLIKDPEITDQNFKLDLIDNVETVTENLDTTLSDLNEAVKIQTTIHHQRELVNLELILISVEQILSRSLLEKSAKISTDFKVADVNYVGQYLESIFLNLISNSLKYSHPDRAPQVKISSGKTEAGEVYLQFEDNGVGIDLELNKDKVFGLYKTFHKNKDSRGVGLFLVKSQIETLGGTITVESEVNRGTTFKIILNVKKG